MLNSLSAYLTEVFMYVHSSKQLWYDLSERYRHTSGPLVFQLQNELRNLKQEKDSILTYFNNLDGIWDEVVAIDGIPSYSYGAIPKYNSNPVKKIAASDESNKLVQYLM